MSFNKIQNNVSEFCELYFVSNSTRINLKREKARVITVRKDGISTRLNYCKHLF